MTGKDTEAMLRLQSTAYRSGFEAAREQAALIAEMGRWRGTKCAPAVIAVGRAIRAMHWPDPVLPMLGPASPGDEA